jgi:preprotein translocase subunit SecA
MNLKQKLFYMYKNFDSFTPMQYTENLSERNVAVCGSHVTIEYQKLCIRQKLSEQIFYGDREIYNRTIPRLIAAHHRLQNK